MEKKKVELFICPLTKRCTGMFCVHREPHEHGWCDSECVRTGRPHGSSICVPYKLQIGDRVLVLESMRGVVDEKGWDGHMKREVGKEHVIRDPQDSFYSDAGVRLEGVGHYSWPVDHLQYVGRGRKEEVFYKTGDKFVYDDKTAVIVVQKGGNQMAGLVLQDGYDKNVCWSSFVPVADLDKITQEEFGEMCGVTPSSLWTKL